jgi:hypothetical protein
LAKYIIHFTVTATYDIPVREEKYIENFGGILEGKKPLGGFRPTRRIHDYVVS